MSKIALDFSFTQSVDMYKNKCGKIFTQNSYTVLLHASSFFYLGIQNSLVHVHIPCNSVMNDTIKSISTTWSSW